MHPHDLGWLERGTEYVTRSHRSSPPSPDRSLPLQPPSLFPLNPIQQQDPRLGGGAHRLSQEDTRP